MVKKLSHDEYVKLLETTGWDLETGSQAFPVKNKSLKELLNTAHTRHKKGEATGIIKHIEDALELTMVEMEQLWEHLGLPK